MSTINLSNIPLDALRAFLLEKDYQFGFVHAGHELWIKEDMVRPVVLRVGFEPVPVFVVRNILRNMGADGMELEAFMRGKENRSPVL